jgi:hypothetical protein
MPARVKMVRPTNKYTQWNRPLILPKNSSTCLCIASHILEQIQDIPTTHPPTLKWRMDDT